MHSSYKDLIVWQKSTDLTVEIYHVTQDFPKTEQYGLASQMRRCAVSIPSNIAEGQRRGHQAEFIQFLRIAYGSGAELETQLHISQKLKFLDDQQYQQLNQKIEEIMRMLNRLLQTTKAPQA